MNLNDFPFHHSFDKEYLADIYDNDVPYFLEIITHLLKNIEPELEQLKQYCHDNDYANFAKKLHKISSIVGCVGQVNASVRYKELETSFVKEGIFKEKPSKIVKDVLQTMKYIEFDYLKLKNSAESVNI